jgi:hypothetical protein
MPRSKRGKKIKRIQTTRQFGRLSRGKILNTRQKTIKSDKYADYQLKWQNLIPKLESRNIVKWQKVEFLSVMGDAPKDFVTDKEDRIAARKKSFPFSSYIAKVGSKFYPVESVVEQLITVIGECYGINIANSKLRIVEGQVRFMSKYFLRKNEQLTHGAEILALSLGKEEYEELEKEKRESEYFTFQMVCEAITNAFSEDANDIIAGLIQMLAFDVLIGHNDRHPYNWGVVVPLEKSKRRRFSPIYDTARALFWNVPESRVRQMLTDQSQLDVYIKKCEPPFCWDNRQHIDFFELIGLIWNERPTYRHKIETFLTAEPLEKCIQVLATEFGDLLTDDRFELIRRRKCLNPK